LSATRYHDTVICMADVAFAHCETYQQTSVDAAVRRAVDMLGGMRSFVRSNDRILLKPNLLSASAPEKHITTHPAVVRALASLVLEAGGVPMIGDSPALHPFARVAEKTGMRAVAEDLQIELVELTHPVTVVPPPDSSFRKLEIASLVMEVDAVINIPKLKTHSQMLLTLGIKNLFGTVVGKQKGEWHFRAGIDRDIFASLMLDIYRIVHPVLTLIDGVWAMEGHGPSNGIPRALHLIAAARDAVALDTSVCRLLHAPLSAFAFYRVAKKRNIGETDLDRISLKGDAVAVSDFALPALDSVSFLPDFLNRFARKFLVSKPVHHTRECSRCRECEYICPAQAIRIGDQKAFIDYERCIRCFCCQEVCPQNAIGFHEGLLLRLADLLKP